MLTSHLKLVWAWCCAEHVYTPLFGFCRILMKVSAADCGNTESCFENALTADLDEVTDTVTQETVPSRCWQLTTAWWPECTIFYCRVDRRRHTPLTCSHSNYVLMKSANSEKHSLYVTIIRVHHLKKKNGPARFTSCIGWESSTFSLISDHYAKCTQHPAASCPIGVAFRLCSGSVAAVLQYQCRLVAFLKGSVCSSAIL